MLGIEMGFMVFLIFTGLTAIGYFLFYDCRRKKRSHCMCMRTYTRNHKGMN